MALAPQEVGARIEHARKAKGWTHQDFADRVSDKLGRRVNLRTVQRWQKGINPSTGRSWLPRLQTLIEIAEVLEIPTSALVDVAPAEDGGAFSDRLHAVERSQAENSEVLAELRQIEEQNQVLLAELLRRIQGDGDTSQTS